MSRDEYIMMDKEKLRKADFFSGLIILLFGVWIVRQAFKMPMKDSWGGVQNVWFVSPALFPLLVGFVIIILGGLLSRTAWKTVGREEIGKVIRWLLSKSNLEFLISTPTLRYYAIVTLFLSLVYLNVPRIDFFLASFLFLFVFITMFYFDDDGLLKKFFFFYLVGVGGLILYFVAGIDTSLHKSIPYAGDGLALFFILSYCFYAWAQVRNNPNLRRKYRTGLIITLATLIIVLPIFKYFLLVPMPTEGLVVTFLDKVWYLDF
jgi:hypothetical protein